MEGRHLLAKWGHAYACTENYSNISSMTKKTKMQGQISLNRLCKEQNFNA